MQAYRHTPVMVDEVVALLKPCRNENYIDGTIGGAGHAWAIAHRTGPKGKLLGLDVDARAVAASKERMKIFGSRVTILKASYAELTSVLKQCPDIFPIAGIIIDLGLSSDQLEETGRGFSFKGTGKLDMRFDQDGDKTASDILMRISEEDLRILLKKYGEVRQANRLARAMIRLRDQIIGNGISGAYIPTERLTEEILRVIPKQYGHIHPATTVFQALRIAVNRELDAISGFLPQAVTALDTKGKLAVISYHSLEDRIVKNFFKLESRDCVCQPDIPVCRCNHHKTVRIITKKPIRPSLQEQKINPRSRSACLRVIQKIKQ